eukprot:TRINITY_DN13178_c0_g1_i1.p1 TRINITY_DN13178_c0_g1~~TRINITY_DN13178_c0_g1_i1.p1  ORF type:complete len:376 (-),score=58.30 TRINITY_DN13178_c0_g1_i1:188-1315(-)
MKMGACIAASGHPSSSPMREDMAGTSASACWLQAALLQRASTQCALLGSAVAVVGIIRGADERNTQDLQNLRCTWSELAALALICTSLGLEAAAICQRRYHGHRNVAGCLDRGECLNRGDCLKPSPSRPGSLPQESVSLTTAQQVLPFFRVLGLAALAMGCFTAFGTGAAQRLGIVPRTWGGLPGVFFGCFVHFSWPHFGWNALALVLLGPCVLFAASTTGSDRCRAAINCGSTCNSVTNLAAASAFIALSSGFCVWCLARPALHAGASGVVCGYVGLLLALVLRRRDLPLGTLLMVLGVVACYGSALLLHRPATGRLAHHGRLLLYEACTSQSTSSEHHTFGFLSGLASALFFCRSNSRPQSGAEALETRTQSF